MVKSQITEKITDSLSEKIKKDNEDAYLSEDWKRQRWTQGGRRS